jgi:hypothetical protein
MKSLRIAAYLLIGAVSSSCVTTQVAKLGATSEKEPEVYITRTPERQYEEISYIEASGSIFHTKEQLLKKLKKKAKKEGGDALVQVRFDYTFYLPYAEGVVIKYK